MEKLYSIVKITFAIVVAINTTVCFIRFMRSKKSEDSYKTVVNGIEAVYWAVAFTWSIS